MTNYEKLLAKLTEIFQLDQADLDFGIYRIMNSKRDEIVRFLEKDLLPQVKAVLTTAQGDMGTSGAEELATVENQIRAAGMNPDDSPKVRELRAKYAGGGDIGALEQEVFDHLYSFFRRYYDEGDFLSLRRYKEGVYAIPYEGEEVKLHWANADQYYIKTAEHFRDFIFKVGEKRVHFKLVDAQTERDNSKEQEKRVFILAEENPVVEENGELIIRFEYRNDSAKRKQKDLTEAAITTILGDAPSGWKALLTAKAPAEKDPNRTILAKRLNDYTARNTFDYFIHKDLGRFLRRELDFYIKNEVMHLDDIENEAAPKVERYLAKVRAIRRVASKLIDFLSQLEEFQKALWLKKPFVVETNYLITLDLIAESLYPTIADNELQVAEWTKTLSLDKLQPDLTRPAFSLPLSTDYLSANRGLVVSTALFPVEFKTELLKGITDIDEATIGIAVRGHNFQFLQLGHSAFKGKVDAVYIDPPYNTDASAILYKNDYKDSTWIAMMHGCLGLAKPYLRSSGVICCAIDDEEVVGVRMLLSQFFPKQLGISVVRSNPQSRKASGKFSPVHEYALFFGASQQALPGSLDATSKQLLRYPLEDDLGKYAWMNFIRTGNGDKRSDRPKLFYPIYVDANDSIRVPRMEWDDETEAYRVLEEPSESETVVLPITLTGEPVEKRWHRGFARIASEPGDYRVRRVTGGKVSIDFKTRMDDESAPTTWWDVKEYASANYGAAELKALFGKKPFDYPKATKLVSDCILASTTADDALVLDFFAGSGTTVSAVLALNREDGGSRRFMVVESGRHYYDVVLPRITKSLFSANWQNGIPVVGSECTGIVKCISLEGYEDSLSNIEFRRQSGVQSQLLERNEVREDYMLHYWLQDESNGCHTVLNVAAFSHPFQYLLEVSTGDVGEYRSQSVDLVETFNWLLGLRVRTMDVIRGFHVVTGRLPGQGNSENGEKALIIWRDTTENPNAKLDEFFGKQAYNTLDQEFDVIYVNGDNNLQNLRKDDQTWKVRLIEEEFHRLMWATEHV